MIGQQEDAYRVRVPDDSTLRLEYINYYIRGLPVHTATTLDFCEIPKDRGKYGWFSGGVGGDDCPCVASREATGPRPRAGERVNPVAFLLTITCSSLTYSLF